MKKIILILDGMADRGQEALNGKTPLEYADTPNLDALFSKAQAGTVQTIPDGEEAGSAVANLNMLGYTSAEIYKGRAVIEAAGADIPVYNDSLYIRTNLITLKGDSFEEGVIESYSAHDIETEHSRPLVKRLNEKLFGDGTELINTDSFRNILVAKGKTGDYGKLNFMPPHDIIGQSVKEYLKGNDTEKKYYEILKKAYEILNKDNDTKANAIWFWGASVAPDTEKAKSFDRKIILSETTLMRGISKLLDLKCVSILTRVTFESFLEEKLEAALEALDGESNFVYLHIQEPDDLSHELMPKKKAEALEAIDKIFVKGLSEKLDSMQENFSLVVASDHYTFSDTGGHGRQPAPFMLYKKGAVISSDTKFSESACNAADNLLKPKELLAKM
jgi:2,3-bisphosphoglycerate-independent phosphoglycerate mutase